MDDLQRIEELERRVADLEWYRSPAYEEERARIAALAFGGQGADSLPFSDYSGDEVPTIVSVGKKVGKFKTDKGEIGWGIIWFANNGISYAVARKLQKDRTYCGELLKAGTLMQGPVKHLPSTYTVLEWHFNPYHPECVDACGA